MRTIIGLIAGGMALFFLIAVLLTISFAFWPITLLILIYAIYLNWKEQESKLDIDTELPKDHYPKLTKEQLKKINEIIYRRPIRKRF